MPLVALIVGLPIAEWLGDHEYLIVGGSIAALALIASVWIREARRGS